MRVELRYGVSALLLGVAAAPAGAQEEPLPVTVSGGAALVSDYRYRGISQTDRRFAVQGTFTLGHESGLYGTVWDSSIDDYVYNGADQEIDFLLGYQKTFGATTVDGGVLYYHYLGSDGIDSDFFEPSLSITHAFGPVTAKASAAYAPEQRALSVGAEPPR